MNSSTSSSNHRRFPLWVLAALVGSGVVVDLIPWGAILVSRQDQLELAGRLGGGFDYLIVGDSKARPFGWHCVQAQVGGYRGVVFAADSVTPVYHYDLLREIRAASSDFAPKLVFILIGANNMNANGLHAMREYTFYNLLSLTDVWDLSVRQGEYVLFAEAVLSRIVPVYGKRLMITHLALEANTPHVCPEGATDSFDDPSLQPLALGSRDPVADRNYVSIYRRSLYNEYETSPMVASALERLIRLIREWGGVPVLVLAPVTPEIRDLGDELVGDTFDVDLGAIAARERVEILDLRDEARWDFNDVNHLSSVGARDALRDRFLPIMRKHLGNPRPH